MEQFNPRGAETANDAADSWTVCRNCGTRVSTDFARVFGDNEGRVHECHDCTGE